MTRTRTRLAKLLLTLVVLGAPGCTDVAGIPPSDRRDDQSPPILAPADTGSGSGVVKCKPPCKGPQ